MTRTSARTKGENPETEIGPLPVACRKPWTRLGIVMAASVLYGIFLPGLVAYHRDVFDTDGVRRHLSGDLQAVWHRYELRRQELDARAASARTAIEKLDLNTASPEREQSMLQLESAAESAIAKLRPPFRLIGFSDSPQLLLWPLVYMSLGVLAFVAHPPKAGRYGRKSIPKIFGLAAVIHVAYDWPLYARNFLLNHTRNGRTVVAYPNLDIDPFSFFVQELLILAACILFVRVWIVWYTAGPDYEQDLGDGPDMVVRALAPRPFIRLVSLYHHWQLSSVVLAVGLAPFSFFYWSVVIDYGDRRYLASAITAHILWGTTWCIVSIPLVRYWHSWERTRSAALSALSTGEHSEGVDRAIAIKVLQEQRPASVFSSIATTSISIATFTLPIVRHLLGG